MGTKTEMAKHRNYVPSNTKTKQFSMLTTFQTSLCPPLNVWFFYIGYQYTWQKTELTNVNLVNDYIGTNPKANCHLVSV